MPERIPAYISAYKGGRSVARRALKIALQVKKLVNVETKSFQQDLFASPSSSGTVTHLLALAQGDDFNNRQGRSVKLQSIRIKGNVQMHASATDSTYRLMIVRDNNGSTTQPAITDLFVDVTAFQNNENKLGDPQSNSRFTVLFDRYYIMTTAFSERHSINKYIKIRSHVLFSGTANTDEGKGAIYAFQASNEATNDPVVNANSMIKFIDN